MRTDVKVVLVVVAVLVVLAAVWFAMYYKQPAPPAPAEQAQAPVEEVNVIEERTATPPGFEETATASATKPAPEYGTLETPNYIEEPNAVAPTVEMKMYVVHSGDTYSKIAQREYHNSALSGLIEQANPNIPPRSLRTGLTIKIPPAPTGSTGGESLGMAATDTVVPGTTAVDAATGKRYYVVKKGDNGFSAVAAIVYGNGKYWRHIEDANPGVKSSSLRIGQKLWVPELPRVEGAAGSMETERPALTATGQSTPRRTAPTGANGTSGRTGAPTRERLPDGRSFD